MQSTGESFAEYSLRLSRQHALDLQNQELGAEKEADFRDIARQSIDQQRQLEQDSGESFEHFLERYFNQK
jgi:glutamate--cysteine ligase